MKLNKLAMYSKCKQCQAIAHTLDLDAINDLRDMLETDRARLRYERARLETDRTENDDLLEGKSERYEARLDRLSEISERLYQYNGILEEG